MAPTVAELKGDLDKLVKAAPLDAGLVLDVLNRMEALPMTIDLLKSSMVGKSVNDVRKADGSTAELKEAAKKLVGRWKLLANAPVRSDSASSTMSSSTTSSKASTLSKAPSTGSVPERRLSSGQAAVCPAFPSSGVKARDVARKMLATRLGAMQYLVPASDPGKIAAAIEAKMNQHFGGGGGSSDYKAKLKSLCANVANPKNLSLGKSVLSGEIKPDAFAMMSKKDLEPPETKELKEKVIKAAMDEAHLAEGAAATSKEIQCPRCKKYEVQYAQAQTRSSDEPMTTFCFCVFKGCGHRWKFC